MSNNDLRCINCGAQHHPVECPKNQEEKYKRKDKIKAEERLMEIFMETELSHSVTGSDLRIVAKAILKEFIHLDELPKEKPRCYISRGGVTLKKESDISLAKADSYNECLAEIKKLAKGE